MDYTKWNEIDEDSDGEDEDEQKSYKGLALMKTAADSLFENKEYSQCIGMYLKICHRLRNMRNSEQRAILFVPSQLNLASCHMMSNDWDRCIPICQEMLDSKPCVLNLIQQIRCHYLRAIAYSRRNSCDNDRERALESSTIIQNIISSHPNALQDFPTSEYNELHHSLTESANRYVKPLDGFDFLASTQYAEAKAVFTEQLSTFYRAHRKDRNAEGELECSESLLRVADYLEGFGEASCHMAEMDEASVAYERAGTILVKFLSSGVDIESMMRESEGIARDVPRAHSRDKSRELFLRSAGASLWSIQNQLKEAPGQNGDTMERLQRATGLFKRVALMPEGEKGKSVMDSFCLVFAKLGIAHCQCFVGDIAIAERLLREGISEGICVITGCAETGSFKTNRSLDTAILVTGSGVSDSLERVCVCSTAVSSLCAQSSFCLDSDLMLVFVAVVESYGLLIALLKKKGRWGDVRTSAEDAAAFVEMCGTFQNFQGAVDIAALLQLTINLSMLKSVSMEHMDCVEVDDTLAECETICDKAEILTKSGSYREAFKLYCWCGDIFKKQSNIEPFVLDDKILHTENHLGAESATRAVEIYGMAANCCAKYIIECNEALEESHSGELSTSERDRHIQDLNKFYIHLMRMHLNRGICASSRGLAQRYLESAHTVREEFMRVLYLESGGRSPVNLLGTDDSLHNYLTTTHGEICFYLAYTYMRSGKIKYAIEEARSAVSVFEDMRAPRNGDGDDLAEFGSSQRQRLRHAWGLVAVISCSMGETEEAMEESKHALRMVREFDIGPVQDSTEELERLRRVLEFNRRVGSSSAESNIASTSASVQAINSSHPQRMLEKNWTSVSEKDALSKRDGDQRRNDDNSSGSAESSIKYPEQGRDYNLLLAVLILSAVSTMIMWGLYSLFFY